MANANISQGTKQTPVNPANWNELVDAINTLQGKVFDVVDYGAVGDGAVDDTAAIQTALDAAETAGGGVVFFPSGTYKLSAVLTVGDNITIDGAGESSVLELADTSNCSMITNNDHSSGNSNIIIKNILLDGNITNQGVSTNYQGIEYSKVTDGRVDNVHVKKVMATGIRMEFCNRIVISRCTVEDTGDDAIDPNEDSTNIIITNCFVLGTSYHEESGTSGAHAIEIQDGAHGVQVIGNYLKGYTSGVQVMTHDNVNKPCYDIIITDNILTENGGAAVYVGTTMHDVVISNNNIYHTVSGTASIRIYNAANVVISGNNIESVTSSTGAVAIAGTTDKYSEEIILQGNYFYGRGNGVLLSYTKKVSILGNIIANSGNGITASDINEHTTIIANVGINNDIPVRGTFDIDTFECLLNRWIDPVDPWNNYAVKYYDYGCIQVTDRFINCVAAATDAVHAAITGTGSENTVITAITDPDVPRNVSITTTDVSSPEGDVGIRGWTAKGRRLITEYVTIVAGGTAYTDKAFATVYSIKIPETVSADDTVEVGISDKLGLSRPIVRNSAAATYCDVYKITKNGANISLKPTNSDYDTVDCSEITVNDDFIIYYRSSQNRYD